METDIESGGKEVIASGVFTTFDETPSDIIIKKGAESFQFNFLLSNDQSNQPRLDLETYKDDKKNRVFLKFKLFNFNDSVGGTSLINPIHIGNFDNGDKVLLHLTIRKIPGDSKLHEVTYTIYLEKIKNGKTNLTN